MSGLDLHDQLLALVPDSLRARSGGVLFAGRSAFTGAKPLYILGLNPGGDPEKPGRTIQSSIELSAAEQDPWSVFAVGERLAGESRFHARVQHLITSLDPSWDTRSIPTSNVVFARSKREADIAAEKETLLEQCWPVHQLAIEKLGVRVVVCLGRTAGHWVAERLGARTPAGEFVEENNRKWRSFAHANDSGVHVVSVTHPSIADWTTPASDPTPLVRDCLERSTTRG